MADAARTAAGETSSIPLVDLKAQYASIRDEVEATLHRVLEETSYVLGPQVELFERAFASYCGVEHAVGVANGTDAVHLALRAFGIGPGDEVLVPAMTFVATAVGVTLAGARPVLVDVRREDALLDPDKIESAITPRTKAVVPVHLYGRCANMEAIQEIATRYGLLVIEDAAQAHGASFRGRTAGSFGAAAAFSFYPAKNLGAYGDAGAISTNDGAVAERLRLLRNIGSRIKYQHEELGINSRLDTLHAAILSVKLRHLPAWNEARRRHAATYDRLLLGRDDVVRIESDGRSPSAWHLFVVRVKDRDERLARLRSRGITAGIHYPFPIHRLRVYRELDGPGGFPEAESWARECLSLPLYPEMTEDQIGRVVAAL